jgi:hypothetical protein
MIIIIGILILGLILWIGGKAAQSSLKASREYKIDVLQGLHDINDTLTSRPYEAPDPAVVREQKLSQIEYIDAKLIARKGDRQAVDSLLKEIEKL